MSFLRRSPFGGADPAEFMIGLIAQQAQTEGAPLSEGERKLLATECTLDSQIPVEVEKRLKGLVHSIVERENVHPESDYRVRTFLNAIEWVDESYPYVLALAVAVSTGHEIERFDRLAAEPRRLPEFVVRLTRFVLLLVLIALLVVVIRLRSR
jgi:hypothetical protein